MCPSVALDRVGIDTYSPAWYVGEGSPAARALDQLATNRASRGSMLLPRPVAGHRVGWFPGTHLVFAEGHLAGEGQLGPVSALPGAVAAIAAAIRGVGVPLPEGRSLRPWRAPERRPGFAGLRRVDAAADLRFEDPALGLAVLEVVAAVDPPRAAVSVWRRDGRVQTVAVRGYGSGRVLGRVYDKGAESKSAPRGQLIRLEDQRRYQSGTRPTADAGGLATVHELFRERFSYASHARMVVGRVPDLARHLAPRVADGTIPLAKLERVLGFLALQGMGGDRSHLPRATYYRRRAEARELGVVAAQAPGATLRELDLAAIFDLALGAGAWERIEQDAAAAAAG